jgi:hypothetical protein
MKCEALSSNEAHGITYTEIFDLAMLQRAHNAVGSRLAKVSREMKEQVVSRLREAPAGKGHMQVVSYCKNHRMPLLTTNFDLSLEKVFEGAPHTASPGNRRYYPWNTYYAPNEHKRPLSSFGIWHIHGSIEYPDSLRLGLNDYVGAMERIRSEFFPFASWVFNGKKGVAPTAAKRLQGTWVEIFLTRSPIIVGLELAPYDALLRWLLIRRAAAHFKLPVQVPGGIYLSCRKDEPKQGMEDFFRLLNIEVITVDDFPLCYDLFEG